jgi:hypothetical protein
MRKLRCLISDTSESYGPRSIDVRLDENAPCALRHTLAASQSRSENDLSWTLTFGASTDGCLGDAAGGSGSSTSQAITAPVGTGSSPSHAREIAVEAPVGGLEGGWRELSSALADASSSRGPYREAACCLMKPSTSRLASSAPTILNAGGRHFTRANSIAR